MIVDAFTCTGAYAILILAGIKRVENRSMWPVPEKGWAAISCSKSFSIGEYRKFMAWAAANLRDEDFARLPSWEDVKDWPGKVIGVCGYFARRRIDGAAEPWDEGYDAWWDLRDVTWLDEPVPCKGCVGMWKLPGDVSRRVTWLYASAKVRGRKVQSAEDAAKIFSVFMPVCGDSEGFFVLPLSADGGVLSAPVLVSLGHELGTTAIDAKEVFRAAFKVGADAVIVAHNHPSGDLMSSKADIETTRELQLLSDRLGMKFIDHLIICKSGFKSVMQVSAVAR